MVVARGKVNVVGDDLDRPGAGADDTRVQAQQRFTPGQFDINVSVRRRESAIRSAAGDDTDAVSLAHGDVVVSSRAGGAAVDHGQFRKLGGKRAGNTGRRDVEVRVGRDQFGRGHVEQTGRVEVQVGPVPAGAGTRLQGGRGGVVVQIDALEVVVEFNRTRDAVTGDHHQFAVVELDRLGGGEADLGLIEHRHRGVKIPEYDAVVAVATVELEVAAWIGQNQVVAFASVNRVQRAGCPDQIVAAATVDDVLAGAHVDDVGAFTADKLVVAVAAQEDQAALVAADKFILANTATDGAARSTAQNHEAVVASAALEIELSGNSLVNIDEVIALAAVGDDLFDRCSVVGNGFAQRVHQDLRAIGVGVDVVGLVDSVVVQLATAIAPGGVAHVQMQRTVGVEVADVGRCAPAPGVAARERNAHDGGARRHVGAGRRDVDLAAETRQREIDGEESHVEFEIKRTPGCCGKARLAAEQHANTGVEVQRAEVNVNLGLAMDLELAVRGDEATNVNGERIEEVQAAVKLELEDGIDHAHAAPEVHIKGQDLQSPLHLQIEQGVGGDGRRLAAAVGQRGIGHRAGVDLQGRIGFDVHHRDADLNLGLHIQGEERRVACIRSEGGRTLDSDFAEVTEVQRHIHRRLHAVAVDQQINRAAQFNRPDRNTGPARNAQHLLGKINLRDLAVGVIEGASHRIAPTHPLRHTGGVDLQQELAFDIEDAATVDDGGGWIVATHFEAAVKTGLIAAGGGIDHHTQRAGDAQRFEHRQVQHGGDAEFERNLGIDLGDDDAEVALQIERTREQVQVALAGQGGIHAGPAGVLARRVGTDGEGAKAGQGLELLRHLIGDGLTESIETQVHLSGQLGDRPEVEVGRHVHAQRHTTAVDHQQAGGVTLHVEAVRTNLHIDIGKRRQALALAEAEVKHTGHGNHAEQVHLGQTINPQQLLGVSQHNRLRWVAGGDRVAGIPDVVFRFCILVDQNTADHQRRIHPATLGKVDGGKAERHTSIVKRDRASCVVAGIAGVDAGTQAGVHVKAQVLRVQNQAFRHADQPDVINICLHRHVQADIHAGQINHQLLGNHHAEVEMANRQTDGIGVGVIG